MLKSISPLLLMLFYYFCTAPVCCWYENTYILHGEVICAKMAKEYEEVLHLDYDTGELCVIPGVSPPPFDEQFVTKNLEDNNGHCSSVRAKRTKTSHNASNDFIRNNTPSNHVKPVVIAILNETETQEWKKKAERFKRAPPVEPEPKMFIYHVPAYKARINLYSDGWFKDKLISSTTSAVDGSFTITGKDWKLLGTQQFYLTIEYSCNTRWPEEKGCFVKRFDNPSGDTPVFELLFGDNEEIRKHIIGDKIMLPEFHVGNDEKLRKCDE